jgi:hypothetical protein
MRPRQFQRSAGRHRCHRRRSLRTSAAQSRMSTAWLPHRRRPRRHQPPRLRRLRAAAVLWACLGSSQRLWRHWTGAEEGAGRAAGGFPAPCSCTPLPARMVLLPLQAARWSQRCCGVAACAAGRRPCPRVRRVPCAVCSSYGTRLAGWRLNPDPGQPPRGSGWLLAACMICESNEKSADSINR